MEHGYHEAGCSIERFSVYDFGFWNARFVKTLSKSLRYNNINGSNKHLAQTLAVRGNF